MLGTLKLKPCDSGLDAIKKREKHVEFSDTFIPSQSGILLGAYYEHIPKVRPKRVFGRLALASSYESRNIVCRGIIFAFSRLVMIAENIRFDPVLYPLSLMWPAIVFKGSHLVTFKFNVNFATLRTSIIL